MTKKQFSITNYKGAKYGKKAVDSDHVTWLLKINLNILPQKPQRVQMFDFKNENGQLIFNKTTSETMQF